MHRTAVIAPGLAFAAWIGMPSGAFADVYKCAGEGGVPVYQEMPCPQGKELRNFQIDPPEITVLPARRPAPDAIREAPARVAPTGKDVKPGNAATAADRAAERKHVRLGMTEGEVLARIGSPDVTVGGRNAVSPRWTYTPAPGDPETVTTLSFVKGVVVDIERKVVKK
jgi:hypothetical protein